MEVYLVFPAIPFNPRPASGRSTPRRPPAWRKVGEIKNVSVIDIIGSREISHVGGSVSCSLADRPGTVETARRRVELSVYGSSGLWHRVRQEASRPSQLFVFDPGPPFLSDRQHSNSRIDSNWCL